MNKEQRAAALRLADDMDTPISVWADHVAHLLRELAAEPQAEPMPGMSLMNRTIAYCAADTLRKLGYEWDGEAWVTTESQAEPVRECADNDSPWLVCKTCAAVGRCAKLPVAWRSKERINGEFDSGWKLTSNEPPQTPRTIAIEPLYTHPPQQRTEYRLAETDIYDFAGWLTTRGGTLVIGTSHEAGPMAEAVGEYLRTFPERFLPQQQQRTPLTDSQIWEIGQTTLNQQGGWNIAFARAVERAHGIGEAP